MMTDQAPCGHGPEQWTGCYAGNWGYWVDEAMSHPAKMAPSLCHRIFDHLEELGLLHEGDTVLDPLCGIGTTLLVGASRGFKAVGVELEDKFVALARQNIAHLERKLGHPLGITIIQGDSRHLAELLQERGLVAVTSPPYGDIEPSAGPKDAQRKYEIVSQMAANKKSLSKRSLSWLKGFPEGKQQALYQRHGDKDYGSAPGQIGALPDRPLTAITSPPYEDAISKGAIDPDKALERWVKHKNEVAAKAPKWPGGRDYSTPGRAAFAKGVFGGYGDTNGQIGQECNETYLDAMRQVFAQIALVADVLVSVSKDPTRNGRLRPLGADLQRLMEETGWKVICHHHAILFSEQTQGHLFEGTRKQVKGRMSFFKRLSYRKGSPVADHEDVLVAVREQELRVERDADEEGGSLPPTRGGWGRRMAGNQHPSQVVITSPPFLETQEGGGIVKKGYKETGDMVADRCGYRTKKHGNTPGQIGKLKG